MRRALTEAEAAAGRGEVPVGAVVVVRGEIVAVAHNERETASDPTAHAEILALRRAAAALGSWRLVDAELFVTMEPCPMCAGALVNARIRRLYYGCDDPKAGAVRTLYSAGGRSPAQPPGRGRPRRARRRRGGAAAQLLFSPAPADGAVTMMALRRLVLGTALLGLAACGSINELDADGGAGGDISTGNGGKGVGGRGGASAPGAPGAPARRGSSASPAPRGSLAARPDTAARAAAAATRRVASAALRARPASVAAAVRPPGSLVALATAAARARAGRLASPEYQVWRAVDPGARPVAAVVAAASRVGPVAVVRQAHPVRAAASAARRAVTASPSMIRSAAPTVTPTATAARRAAPTS